MLSLGQPLHQYHVGAPFGKCHYGALAVFPHYGIHLPVPETCSVSFGRPLVYAYAVGYVLYSGGTVGPAVTVVFHSVATVRGEFSAFIGTDMTVYEFVGDVLSALFHIRRNLFRRPVFLSEQIQRLPQDRRIFCVVGRGAPSTFQSPCMSLVPQIVAFLRGIAFKLAAER